MNTPNSSNNEGQDKSWKNRGTKSWKMVEQILERGDHGEEFKRDFVLYIILICIIRSMNGDCFFLILKSLMDVNQVPNYNWCAYLI